MMIITFNNHKGGTGKTTSVVNIGIALSREGKRVLLVDLDPQGNLTFSMGCFNFKHTIGDVLYGKCNAEQAIVALNNIALIPSNTSIIELNNYYTEDSEDLFELKNCLESVKHKYDYVLIDCSPAISFLTRSAMIAANYIIIPLQLEVLSIQGLEQILREVEIIKENYNPKLNVMGVLAVMVNNSRGLTTEVLEYIKNAHTVNVINNHVRTSVKVAEAPSFGLSVLDYAPECNSSKDYIAVTKELVEIMKN